MIFKYINITLFSEHINIYRDLRIRLQRKYFGEEMKGSGYKHLT